MAQDYIALGPVPCDEDCEQVGTKNYDSQKAFDECSRFKQLILKKFGNPPEGAKVRIKHFPHDFGTYMEVCVVFDEDNQEAIDYAFKVEENLPMNWE
jgi:hypothetical protein